MNRPYRVAAASPPDEVAFRALRRLDCVASSSTKQVDAPCLLNVSIAPSTKLRSRGSSRTHTNVKDHPGLVGCRELLEDPSTKLRAQDGDTQGIRTGRGGERDQLSCGCETAESRSTVPVPSRRTSCRSSRRPKNDDESHSSTQLCDCRSTMHARLIYFGAAAFACSPSSSSMSRLKKSNGGRNGGGVFIGAHLALLSSHDYCGFNTNVNIT